MVKQLFLNITTLTRGYVKCVEKDFKLFSSTTSQVRDLKTNVVKLTELKEGNSMWSILLSTEFVGTACFLAKNLSKCKLSEAQKTILI